MSLCKRPFPTAAVLSFCQKNKVNPEYPEDAWDRRVYNMKKNMAELVMILDRSGSMGGLEKDTIGGFNSMLEKQRREEGEVLVTTVLFDHVVEILHNRVPLEKVRPMTEREYYVRGCTALLDAIGSTIHHIANIHKYAREEDRPEKTIFIITTDGLENASKEYSYSVVKKMVEHEKEKYGWEFLFLGANIDAIATAASFGIGEDRAVRYESDSQGTALNYEVLNDAVRTMRSAAPGAAPMGRAWKSRIEEDYARRGKKDKA